MRGTTRTQATTRRARLQQLDIVLTVPASFDEEARELTVEAARQAGLEQLTLLEEPTCGRVCVDGWPPAAARRAR